MELVTTPSFTWLERALADCKSSIDIASPFIGHELCNLLSKAPRSLRVTLLTRTRLVDFASGASDIKALTKLAGTNARILGLDRLHAKAYVFDDVRALVTSANATFSGLHRNIECGIAVTDQVMAKKLGSQIRSGFAVSPAPSVWSEAQLHSLTSSVEKLKSKLPTRSQIRILENEEAPTLELPEAEAETLLASSTGWLRLVFQQILRMHRSEFTTSEVWQACAAAAAQKFPLNRHPREKVRQQLQLLRDLGLIQFFNHGRYRLTIVTTK